MNYECLGNQNMNFVSPRKLNRIQSNDTVFRDLIAGSIDIWEFCDAIIDSEQTVSSFPIFECLEEDTT